jgi:hypothetical protein
MSSPSTPLCDDNNSYAPQSSLYVTGRDIQLRGVHNIATWVLHLMHGFQTCNIKFLEILICTEPPKTSILFLHSMQINNHYYYYGNNMPLVINNTKKLSCMYFTTSSLFYSSAFGFHTAESIVSSAVLEIYHTTWYKMVQEFRHIIMTAHLKKSCFRFLQLLKLLQLFQRHWQDTIQ